MLPQQQHRARINLHDVKAQMVKRIGTRRANQYFNHFRSFISSRIGKKELDKLVLLTIGKENVALHNQLVRAVFHNAIHAEIPPNSSNDLRSNGDVFNSSLRKGRSNNDIPNSRKKVDDSTTPVDLQRSLQTIQDAAQQLEEAGITTEFVPAVKRLRMLPRIINSTSGEVKRGLEMEFCEEMMQPASYFVRASCSLQRPMGHFYQQLGDEIEEEDDQISDLPDTDSMQKLMEQLARNQGMECVSKECAHILNYAVDALMKKLIKACVDLVGSSNKQKNTISEDSQGLQQQARDNNNNNNSNNNNNMKMGSVSGIKFPCPVEICKPPISLTDFKVAMELHPQQLGENWPVQLEKITSRLFDQ